VSRRATIQWAGLLAGPALAAVTYALLPAQYTDSSGAAVAFTPAGRATLALMAWMASWWLTEAIDISATALLPIAALPLSGAATLAEAAAPYADPVIFLFLGGFMLAQAMQRWGLDRRIALITLRAVGDRPAAMVAGVMAATAVLSMFVSNTATAAMMLPIAMGVVRLIDRGDGRSSFAVCMMLGIAYAASIGGIGTIIGTPPNGFLVGYVRERYGDEITFVRWLAVGLPLVGLFLPVTWLLLTRVIYRVPATPIEGAAALIAAEHERLGRVTRGEWAVLVIFALTAAGWVTRPLLVAVVPGLGDAGIAMIAALALFVTPVDVGRREFVLDWPTAAQAPWGILILFGGGLSLAGAIDRHHVADWIGSLVAGGVGLPPVILVGLVTAGVIFLTELTSNTATTATLVPILAALAPGLGIEPILLIVPAALAASCAFMMPVATPPNAIVFASGAVTIPQMCRAGLYLNIVGIVLITTLAFAVVRPVLGG